MGPYIRRERSDTRTVAVEVLCAAYDIACATICGHSITPGSGMLTRQFPVQTCLAHLRRKRPSRNSRKQPPESLLTIATRRIAQDVQSFDISQLPPDLAQLVLTELLSCGTIDEALFRTFGRQNVFEFDCSEQPGLTDSWLEHFARCPLLRVSLASCIQVQHSLLS